MFLWSEKLQGISGKLQIISGKFQNNVISDVKQILSNDIIAREILRNISRSKGKTRFWS